MTEEKQINKISRNVSALIEKFDTIAKALRAYINENSKRMTELDEEIKRMDERMKKIEETMENIKDYNAGIAKETANSSERITGGFYDLKSRVEDIEMNILKTMKQNRKNESRGVGKGNYGKNNKKEKGEIKMNQKLGVMEKNNKKEGK